MGKILESNWTLDALRRREEERLLRECILVESDVEGFETHLNHELSLRNCVAEGYRRRQEERRATELLNNAFDRDQVRTAHARTRPIDYWLIEGFKRHEEECRQHERLARLAEVLSERSTQVSASTSGPVASSVHGQLPHEQQSLSGHGEQLHQITSTEFDDRFLTLEHVPVAILDRRVVVKTERSLRPAHFVLILSLFAAVGLLFVVGRTMLFLRPSTGATHIGGSDEPNSSITTRDGVVIHGRDAFYLAETRNSSKTRRTDNQNRSMDDTSTQIILPPIGTPADGTKLLEKPDFPSPRFGRPATLTLDSLVTPIGRQGQEMDAPAVMPESKPLRENKISPTVTPENAPSTTTEQSASPKQREQKSNSESTSVDLDRKTTKAEPRQSSKTKAVTGHRPSPKSDGFFAFLKRTTTSFRKFFGSPGSSNEGSRR